MNGGISNYNAQFVERIEQLTEIVRSLFEMASTTKAVEVQEREDKEWEFNAKARNEGVIKNDLESLSFDYLLSSIALGILEKAIRELQSIYIKIEEQKAGEHTGWSLLFLLDAIVMEDIVFLMQLRQSQDEKLELTKQQFIQNKYMGTLQQALANNEIDQNQYMGMYSTFMDSEMEEQEEILRKAKVSIPSVPMLMILEQLQLILAPLIQAAYANQNLEHAQQLQRILMLPGMEAIQAAESMGIQIDYKNITGYQAFYGGGQAGAESDDPCVTQRNELRQALLAKEWELTWQLMHPNSPQIDPFKVYEMSGAEIVQKFIEGQTGMEHIRDELEEVRKMLQSLPEMKCAVVIKHLQTYGMV